MISKRIGGKIFAWREEVGGASVLGSCVYFSHDLESCRKEELESVVVESKDYRSQMRAVIPEPPFKSCVTP